MDFVYIVIWFSAMIVGAKVSSARGKGVRLGLLAAFLLSWIGVLLLLMFLKPAPKRTTRGLDGSASLECPHAILVPKWGNVQDMGIEAKATHFTCDSCAREFTPAEATEVRQGIAAKLVGHDAVLAEEAIADAEAEAAKA